MGFSADGQMVAWSNMASVKIAEVGEEGGKWTIKFELQQPKVSLILKCIFSYTKNQVMCLAWSPKGNLLATWEQYTTTAGKAPEPNLHLFNMATGEKVKSFFQKKMAG